MKVVNILLLFIAILYLTNAIEVKHREEPAAAGAQEDAEDDAAPAEVSATGSAAKLNTAVTDLKSTRKGVHNDVNVALSAAKAADVAVNQNGKTFQTI